MARIADLRHTAINLFDGDNGVFFVGDGCFGWNGCKLSTEQAG